MKYIDAEKLKSEIENIALFPTKSADYNDGREDMKMMILDLIDSLSKETPAPEQAMQSLDEKIKSAKKSWEGVDADKFMDEVRGREETPQRWISVKDRLPEDSGFASGGLTQERRNNYEMENRQTNG